MSWGTDDKYSVVLLHMNGIDASTTFTDESGKIWTPAGGVQIDNSQSKFGGSSGFFDGTGDYISSPDNIDYQLDSGSDSNKWTVDFWVRFNGDPGTSNQGFMTHYESVTDYWSFALSNNTLVFVIRSAATNIVLLNPAWNPAGSTWYHVAIVKDGTNGYMMFIDGTQIGSTTTDTDPMPNYTGVFYIGLRVTAAGANEYLNGWMDEVRFSKGIARWTSNFSVPTKEYYPLFIA